MESGEYAKLREVMVATQLAGRDISSARVLDAMRTVPRELFVPLHLSYRAYDDSALPIGEGQTISQPYMVAKMTELLDLKGSEKVLEIGTGSGYQSALLGALCAQVHSIERIPALALRAKNAMASAGITNVHVHLGDGTLGWPGGAPYDRILVTAGAPEIPAPLLGQLSEGGALVAPVGSSLSQQLVRAVKLQGGEVEYSYHTLCVFVPLIGEYGWKEEG